MVVHWTSVAHWDFILNFSLEIIIIFPLLLLVSGEISESTLVINSRGTCDYHLDKWPWHVSDILQCKPQILWLKAIYTILNFVTISSRIIFTECPIIFKHILQMRNFLTIRKLTFAVWCIYVFINIA